jgi:hypothetical protein
LPFVYALQVIFNRVDRVQNVAQVNQFIASHKPPASPL